MVVLEWLVQLEYLVSLVLFLFKPVLPERFVLLKLLHHLVAFLARCFVVVVHLFEFLVYFFEHSLFLVQFLLQLQDDVVMFWCNLVSIEVRTLGRKYWKFVLVKHLFSVVCKRISKFTGYWCSLWSVLNLAFLSAVDCWKRWYIHLNCAWIVREVTNRIGALTAVINSLKAQVLQTAEALQMFHLGELAHIIISQVKHLKWRDFGYFL
jgi:hypothetical protein